MRKAVGEFVPELAAHAMVAGSMQIFDFSERKQSNQAATLVPARRFGGSPHAEVLVTRVGDALQEPFWPEVRSSSPPPPPPPHMAPCVRALPACLHSPRASLIIALADPSHIPTTATRHPPHARTPTHIYTYT